MNLQECPHGEPWTSMCGFCDEEGIDVPQAVLDAAERQDRRERKAQ